MADETENLADEEQPPSGLINKLKAWAGESGHRKLIIGVGLGVLAVGTVALWLIFAQVAAGPEEVTIDLALRALDEGEDDLAKALVEQIQEQGLIRPGEYGGPLFVLGALKVREAERQWSVERQISEYLIASRYLNEAYTVGFPEERISEGLFLLGKSLIGSRQLTRGIDVLQSALSEGSQSASDAHYLLAEAFFFAPKPRFKESVKQLDKALAPNNSWQINPDSAYLLRAEALTKLGDNEAAQKSLAEVSENGAPARKALVQGKIYLHKLEELKKSGANLYVLQPLADQMAVQLNKARRLDKLATSISRESDFLLSKRLELLDEPEEALASYSEIRRFHHSTPSGAAASISEGHLHRQQGNDREALNSYRRAFDALHSLKTYRSSLNSLSDLRLQIRAAHTGFLEDRKYAAALELNNHIVPLFNQTEQIEMRAKLLSNWGKEILAEANLSDLESPRALARLRFREAGQAYEQLAEAKFATRDFTDILWTAADSHYKGQSYESVIRILDRYLRHEPQQRAALALLRLGQSHLARGEHKKAIADLEECLEFHPTDASSYLARLECAKTYRIINQPKKAEELLRYNLFQTGMTTDSPEWRDSLFELGRHLVESARYSDAIHVLEDAVDRYPDTAQSLEGRYLIAKSHRFAAKEPLSRLANTSHIKKQEDARLEADKHLNRAEEEYAMVQKQLKQMSSADPVHRSMLRNSLVMRGEVLFELGQYKEAAQAYSSAGALFQKEPFILETLVQTSHCRRRDGELVRARGAIEQAKITLSQLPQSADFVTSTNMTRREWSELLDKLLKF